MIEGCSDSLSSPSPDEGHAKIAIRRLRDLPEHVDRRILPAGFQTPYSLLVRLEFLSKLNLRQMRSFSGDQDRLRNEPFGFRRLIVFADSVVGQLFREKLAEREPVSIFSFHFLASRSSQSARTFFARAISLNETFRVFFKNAFVATMNPRWKK
jgi:hypothetical protein